ncbi:MAG: hypothetical protein MI742_15965 [Desulfobacterales bacterium]|nr:hypothetical protein [Desulfobacterales bacterium]
MNSKERVMAALRLEEPDKIPFIDWVLPKIRSEIIVRKGGDPNMDQAQFAKLIGMDAISMEAYCAPYFCETIVDDNGVEHLQGAGLIKTEADLDKMVFTDPKSPGFFDEAKRFIDKYGDSGLALFAGFRTGMLNTLFSMGMMDFSMALHRNRPFLDTVIERFNEWNIQVLEGLQPLGFDFLMSYDDIAFNSGPMFNPKTLKEVFLPGIQPVLDTIKMPWAFHSDGNLAPVMDDLVGMGMNSIMSFQPDVMNIKEMKEAYGDRICVWGNIDLHYTLTRGSVEETITEVKQRIEECGPGGGFIISSSNAITDYCNVDNVMAMIDTIDTCRDYPINLS